VEDVLVVGEALVDIVERLDGSSAEHPGGSPANVALGLARLGRSVHLLTRIGNDDRGRAVRAHLEASGVHLVEGSITAQRTSTATARIDALGVAAYEFDLDWRLETRPDLARFRGLHAGSIAAFLAPGGDAVLDLIHAAAGRLTVTYDPNARPRLMGDAPPARARVERIVAQADLVKVSDEDLAWLTPGEDPVAVALDWQASGPAVVVVTRGSRGALAACRAGVVEVPAPHVTVIDTVGAGDAFMSGLIDYLAGADLLGGQRLAALRDMGLTGVEEMIAYAARVAAITCSRAGADPPTWAELAASCDAPDEGAAPSHRDQGP